jgi:hypothetical protein
MLCSGFDGGGRRETFGGHAEGCMTGLSQLGILRNPLWNDERKTCMIT